MLPYLIAYPKVDEAFKSRMYFLQVWNSFPIDHLKTNTRVFWYQSFSKAEQKIRISSALKSDRSYWILVGPQGSTSKALALHEISFGKEKIEWF